MRISDWSSDVCSSDLAELAVLFPPLLPRVIVTHTRPEPMLGLLRRLDGGPARTVAHGYISRGGTLDVAGMLFANRSTWAHLAESAARLLNRPDRQRVVSGKRVSVRVDLGGRRIIKKKKKKR